MHDELQSWAKVPSWVNWHRHFDFLDLDGFIASSRPDCIATEIRSHGNAFPFAFALLLELITTVNHMWDCVMQVSFKLNSIS